MGSRRRAAIAFVVKRRCASGGSKSLTEPELAAQPATGSRTLSHRLFACGLQTRMGSRRRAANAYVVKLRSAGGGAESLSEPELAAQPAPL
jgi:hypothetical protein